MLASGSPTLVVIERRVGRRRQRLRHLRLHQHQAAEHAPFVGDLAADTEIDAADIIGGAGGDAGDRARRSGRIGTARPPSRSRLPTFCASRALSFVGLEQRRRQQQMAIEQLPFGADLDRLVLFRPEDLVVSAGEDRSEAAIGRAGAVEFGADRIRRRRIGDIDAAVRQRLQGQAEIEIRHPELRRLRAEQVGMPFAVP